MFSFIYLCFPVPLKVYFKFKEDILKSTVCLTYFGKRFYSFSFPLLREIDRFLPPDDSDTYLIIPLSQPPPAPPATLRPPPPHPTPTPILQLPCQYQLLLQSLPNPIKMLFRGFQSDKVENHI